MLPAFMLPQTITVHGPMVETVDGPQPGEPTTVPAYVERKHTLVRDSQGNEVVSNTSAWLNPLAIEPGQTVTIDGTDRVVIAVEQYEFPRTASHTRIYL